MGEDAKHPHLFVLKILLERGLFFRFSVLKILLERDVWST